MEQRPDAMSIEDDEETFTITCKKCGSSNVEIKNDIRYHESCTTGSMYFRCKNCRNTQELYVPG